MNLSKAAILPLLLLLVDLKSSVGIGGGRERISEYVASGQQFLVYQTFALFESPDATAITSDQIFWFCPPQHAPDSNNDGQYDNVMSHVVGYWPNVEEGLAVGATQSGVFTPHGYTAAWTSKGGVYDEFVFDYDDSTVWKFTELEGDIATIVGWETSMPGFKHGLAITGEGEWLYGNATNNSSMLEIMSKDLGKDLTPEACTETYAEIWNAANANNNSDMSDPESDAKMASLGLGMGAALLSLFCTFIYLF